jgi:hypothetical protein
MTDHPSLWQRSTTRRFLKWLFSWRTARRALISIAVIVTLVGLFYAGENLRGKRAWDKYRQEQEARGEQLDWKTFIPRPVPDEQNFAVTPLIQSWFERSKPHYESWSDRKNKPAGDNYGQAEVNVADAQPKGDWGNRHFMDLSGWGTAFDAIRAGTFSKRQKIEAGKLDLESRAKAAPSVLEGLKTNAAMFVELRAASQRPYCRYPINYNVEDPAEVLLPHLNRIRAVCRRLQLKACAELAAGESDNALEDLRFSLYMTDSLNNEPFLISHLVRIACLGIITQPIWEGLAEHAWSDAQLRELQARLQQYDFVKDVKSPMEAERAAGIVIIDYVRKKGPGELIALIGDAPLMPLNRKLLDWVGSIIPRGWYYQEQANYCRLYEVQLTGAVDVAQTRVSPRRLQANTREFDRVFSEGRLDGVIHHRFMASLFLPSLSGVTRRSAWAQSATTEAALACALERYRLANGEYPETLDALVPRFISSLPHDVITGEPYKYRRMDDGRFIL